MSSAWVCSHAASPLVRDTVFDYVPLNAEEETLTDWVQVGNADGLANLSIAVTE